MDLWFGIDQVIAARLSRYHCRNQFAGQELKLLAIIGLLTAKCRRLRLTLGGECRDKKLRSSILDHISRQLIKEKITFFESLIEILKHPGYVRPGQPIPASI